MAGVNREGGGVHGYVSQEGTRVDAGGGLGVWYGEGDPSVSGGELRGLQVLLQRDGALLIVILESEYVHKRMAEWP